MSTTNGRRAALVRFGLRATAIISCRGLRSLTTTSAMYSQNGCLAKKLGLQTSKQAKYIFFLE
jgi:hypothetical protein